MADHSTGHAPDIITFTANPAIDVATSVDRVVPTRKLRCSAQLRDPGGGGVNVARVVHRLGGSVAAVYPAGGATGEVLRRLMAREGIASRTSELAEETREDFTVTETDTGQQYRFVLPGPHLTGSEWQACLETLAACGPGPRWLVASGSLAPGLPEDFYARIRRIADAWGARMALDTSGPALAAALKEGVYLIKPNLRELGEFVGRPLRGESDWAEAARQVIASGHTEVVALTLGHLGALLATREGVWRAPPLPVTPVSAVGAGDSFLGAMVHGLAAGRTVVDAFRLGVAAGSAALLSAGTGLARCEDIDRLYPTVAAEPL